jgi:hypothetical protein
MREKWQCAIPAAAFAINASVASVRARKKRAGAPRRPPLPPPDPDSRRNAPLAVWGGNATVSRLRRLPGARRSRRGTGARPSSGRFAVREGRPGGEHASGSGRGAAVPRATGGLSHRNEARRRRVLHGRRTRVPEELVRRVQQEGRLRRLSSAREMRRTAHTQALLHRRIFVAEREGRAPRGNEQLLPGGGEMRRRREADVHGERVDARVRGAGR